MNADSTGVVRTADGVRLSWADYGPRTAETIILSHPIGLDSGVWDEVCGLLHDRWRVVTYDGRGHGRSDAPADDYTLDQLVGDAVAILDRLEIDRAHFCGLSLGGMVGQQLAISQPDRLLTLILCNTSAYMGPAESWVQRMDLVRSDGMVAIADMALGRWLSDGFRKRNPTAVDAIRDRLMSCPAQGYTGNCAVIRDLDLRHDIATITIPTLIVTGHDDPATPPAGAYEMATMIRGSKIVELPTSHLSCVEEPGRLVSTIETFLY